MFRHEEIPLHWINRLSFITRKKLAELFRSAGHDITPEEWAILLVLWKEGAQSPSELADVTFKDRTTVTRLVDAMVRKDLVRREENKLDRRRSVVDLSPKSTELKTELVPLAQTLIAQAVKSIPSEDIETTTRTLRTMTENLSALSAQRTDEKEITL